MRPDRMRQYIMPIEVHKVFVGNLVVDAKKNNSVRVKIQPALLLFIASHIQSPILGRTANA